MPHAIVACCAGSVVLLAAISSARAELPPQVYERYQNEAPEAVTITVRKVELTEKEEKHFKLVSIVAEALVDKVTRSATGLKPGDLIHISYVHHKYKEPVPGPSEPDILAEGKSYPAFLEKRDTTYGIAARGYSFRLAQ